MNEIYKVEGENEFRRDFALCDQTWQTGIFAMLNIAGGFARYHKREFIRFPYITQSSVAEVKSQLYIASDQNYPGSSEGKELLSLVVHS